MLLTKQIDDRTTLHIGEMAHVIAQSASGPRGHEGGGADDYDNLVLLCANCHTAVDKAPAAYPPSTLRRWKEAREQEIERAGSERRFSTYDDLKKYIAALLGENRQVFFDVGPKSDIAQADPGSDAIEIWQARKLDTILPNNRKIINAIEANASLLSNDTMKDFISFKQHALAYEQQQFGRTEYYPVFPPDFGKRFEL